MPRLAFIAFQEEEQFVRASRVFAIVLILLGGILLAHETWSLVKDDISA